MERFSALGFHANVEILKVYSTLNGFADDEMDNECLTFWPVRKILLENAASRVRETGYVHFGDFLIDSHTYAFSAHSSENTIVYCHWDERDEVKIADSFDEFFDYYLSEPMKLWPK